MPTPIGRVGAGEISAQHDLGLYYSTDGLTFRKPGLSSRENTPVVLFIKM